MRLVAAIPAAIIRPNAVRGITKFLADCIRVLPQPAHLFPLRPRIFKGEQRMLSVGIKLELFRELAHGRHCMSDEFGIDTGALQPFHLGFHRFREPSAAMPHTRREQGHADMVSAICSDDLDVGEAVAERFYACALRAVAGENRIAAGRDFDFSVPAFCRDEAECLTAPLQHISMAVGDVDEPVLPLSVRDVTSVAKIGDPNVKCCSTHYMHSFPLIK